MIKLGTAFDHIAVIGCGGVASWALPPLIKLLNQCDRRPTLILCDGDTIEVRNLDRQWFSTADIGKNKALALAEKLKDGYRGNVAAMQGYYTNGTTLPFPGLYMFLGCVDNHAARRAILSAVDRGEGSAIIAGNEYIEAESYYYERGFAGSPLDPRLYYPAILTDESGDPTRPRGCTGEAQEIAPQLVLANFSAANHLLWLLHHHLIEKPAQGRQYLREYSPIKTWNFSSKFLTSRAIDLAPPTEKTEEQLTEKE